MKNLICFFAVMAVFSMAFAQMKSSLTQHGITWKFDKQYETGTFANGDYWVVGPITVTSISPSFSGGRNG